MGGVKPTWHNSRFNHSDRSEPYYLEYLNCREQGNALIERKFTAILKIGTEKRRSHLELRLGAHWNINAVALRQGDATTSAESAFLGQVRCENCAV
jgi:hypothetical protein